MSYYYCFNCQLNALFIQRHDANCQKNRDLSSKCDFQTQQFSSESCICMLVGFNQNGSCGFHRKAMLKVCSNTETHFTMQPYSRCSQESVIKEPVCLGCVPLSWQDEYFKDRQSLAQTPFHLAIKVVQLSCDVAESPVNYCHKPHYQS